MANDNLISFAEEFEKRTGQQLDSAKIAAGTPTQPKQVMVDPNKDFVIGMVMDVLSIVSKYADSNPIGVVAALQVVGNTLGQEYLQKLGREKTKAIVAHATVISSQYKPEYRDGKDSEGPEPVAGDQEDESQR